MHTCVSVHASEEGCMRGNSQKDLVHVNDVWVVAEATEGLDFTELVDLLQAGELALHALDSKQLSVALALGFDHLGKGSLARLLHHIKGCMAWHMRLRAKHKSGCVSCEKTKKNQKNKVHTHTHTN